MAEAEQFGLKLVSAGVWRFKNVGTGSFLNLQGSSTKPGTPIIGFHDDGTAANLWQLAYTDVSQGTATLQTGVNGPQPMFVQTNDQSVSAGTQIISYSFPYVLKLVEKGAGTYKLQLTGDGSNMVLTLPDGKDYTQVILEVDNPASQNQVWRPIK